MTDPRVRFFQHVRYTPTCWEWTGAHVGSGYGNFVEDARRASRKYVQAHRFAYEVFVGPIPEGMQLDHLCRNRGCVNPWHLEPVTNRENSQRGAKGRMVRVCVNGHPYTDENTIWRKNGRRRCRTCTHRQNVEAGRRRRRAWACA